MKVKSCKEQLNALTNVSIYVNLGTLEAQLSRQDQIPGESFKSHDVIDVMFIKLKTILKVLTSLWAVAIQNSSNASWNKKFRKYLMEL